MRVGAAASAVGLASRAWRKARGRRDGASTSCTATSCPLSLLKTALFTVFFPAFGVLTGTAACAATVAPLDAAPVTAAAVIFDGEQLKAGSQTWQLVDCDWLELGSTAAPLASTAPRFGIWLTDGSWLPVTAMAAVGAAIQATTPFGLHDLPLTASAGWGVHEVASAPDGLDRVLVASGPLDGRVRGLAEGKLLVATSLDPEPLAFELSEVQGLRLAQPLRTADGLSLWAVSDALRAPTRLLVRGSQVVLAASGQPVAGELLATLRLRVSGGRRQWLSDMAPAQVVEQGAFDVVWPWKRDTDLDGGPLLLGGVRQAKGLTVHSAALLTWKLGGAYSRLRTQLGIADVVAPEGDLVATFSGDGKQLWQGRVRGGQPIQSLDLPLAGIAELRLEVALGERFDIGDHLMLGDAYLIRLAR